MGRWKEVAMCKECGKVYAKTIPRVCEKCGVRLSKKDYDASRRFRRGMILPMEALKIVAVRKKFLSGR